MKANILVFFIGVVSGISLGMNWLASSMQPNDLDGSRIFLPIILTTFALPCLLIMLRRIMLKLVARSSFPNSVKLRYHRYDSLTYLPFITTTLGAIGVQFGITVIVYVVMTFFVMQIILINILLERRQRKNIFISHEWLSFLFLISGFAALIYQIVWQRSLFTAFGVNIESITIIVTIFMLGLGIGSIIGGALSKRFTSLLPQLFLVCEVLIGLFGSISLQLIKVVSLVTLNSSILTVSFTTYALLALPTMLMGATLPILVSYLHQHNKNIGKSVGILYSVNTMGSALACFITADIIFTYFGQQMAVYVAVACNLIVGTLVYRYSRNLSVKGMQVE